MNSGGEKEEGGRGAPLIGRPEEDTKNLSSLIGRGEEGK